MNRAVRWGVLGCAGIVRRVFMPALARTAGQAVAIASRDAAKARAWAAEFDIPRAYGSYSELLADDSLDAVYIPLPNSEHAAWTIKAAEAGKHVFCEKPLAADAAEAGRMVEACRRAGVHLFEAFVYQLHPQSLDIARRIQAGEIGEVRGCTVFFCYHLRDRATNIRMRADLAGGALMDVGCYCVSYARFAFGSEPLAVSAGGTEDPDYRVNVEMSAALQFPAGVGSLFASFRAQGGRERRSSAPRGSSGLKALTIPAIGRPSWFQPDETPAPTSSARTSRRSTARWPTSRPLWPGRSPCACRRKRRSPTCGSWTPCGSRSRRGGAWTSRRERPVRLRKKQEKRSNGR